MTGFLRLFDPARLTQIQLFVRLRPFSLLSSKIGDLSQPSLEWAQHLGFARVIIVM
ncbi:hypothetical protein CSE45_5383 [Citreicella sp. SE45]|nr:hypothetical protein CSE45_5383 [Citreicella sp. SE45]